MTETNNYIGMEFIWFLGVVENRQDPLKIGRCQVRIHGWHTEDKTLIPTEDLFWAHAELPLGITDVSPPIEGTLVRGYFLDGSHGQHPVISHVLPGVPEQIGDRKKGFSDPRTDDQLASEPRPPQSRTFNTDGSGVSIIEADKAERNPSRLNEPTTSKLARGTDTTGKSVLSGTEPASPYAAKYPYNRVLETESGHVLELDDTPGAERVHLFHRSGTFIEMHPNGDVVMKNTKDKFDLVYSNHTLYVMGDQKINVLGNSDFTCQKDVSIQVVGDASLQVNGDSTVLLKGDVSLTIQGNSDISVAGDCSVSVSGALDASAASIAFTTEGAFNITCATYNVETA